MSAHDTGIPVRSEEQAARPRPRAAGERANTGALDRENIVEETESGPEHARQLRRDFAALMRRHLDLAGLHADALDPLPGTVHRQRPLPLPSVRPLGLDAALAAWPSG